MIQSQHLDSTIVTALGKVLYVGKNGDGVIIVDSQSEKPVLEVSEVSDLDTVNLYLHMPKGAGIARIGMDGEVIQEESVQDSHEILINRKEHQPLRAVNPFTSV